MASLLTIGEMSQRSGLAPSALRYYERLGLVRSTRTATNQRRYQRTELRRIAFIRVAVHLGVSLVEIGETLSSLPADRVPTKADWARLSRQWRSRLDERIELLERVRDSLDSCIGCGCLSLRSCRLYNHQDELAPQGPGPVRLLR